ncbi:TetR/AcrR family transcriptional regulator [Pelagibius sp. Alg239-R121]|uniref:TetR/AcrR family transcriptional regulator n=1 Tax=Pelagibius sp. Alg239-R121 TaxID=2993448 RepID=UPI0024A7916B|nr:TetR/AcrR family transcriptional regulator [Pelagibius sp. Alg239-R121]
MNTRKEKTQQRILHAAASAFWLQSYQAVNVNQVCDLAKVNKATLYQHFGSKEALAVAAITQHFERQKTEVYEAALSAAPNPIDRLSGIYQRIYQQHLSRYDQGESCAGCPFVNISSEMASSSSVIRDAVDAVFTHFRTYYRLIARDAKVIGYANRELDGDVAAPALVTIMNGALVSAKAENRPDAILESLDTAKLILRG